MLSGLFPTPGKEPSKVERENAQLRAAARQALAEAGLPPEEELAGYRRLDQLFGRMSLLFNLGVAAFVFATIALVAAIVLAILQQWLWSLLAFAAGLNAVDTFYRFIERVVKIRFQISGEFLTPIRRQLLVRMRLEADYWYATVVQFPSVAAMAPWDPETSFIAEDDLTVMHSRLTRAVNRIIDGAEAEGAEVWERLINQEAGLQIPFHYASRLKYTLLPIFPGQE